MASGSDTGAGTTISGSGTGAGTGATASRSGTGAGTGATASRSGVLNLTRGRTRDPPLVRTISEI